MTKSRALSISLVLQILGLVSLSQPWFSISMQADATAVQLGQFEGSSAFPSASPLALLSLAALAVVAISSSLTRRIAISLSAVSSLFALFVTTPQIVAQNVSALDGQLDRLTGIANTHGLQSVDIETYWIAFAWVAVTALSTSFSLWMLRLSGSWHSQDRSELGDKKFRKRQKTSPKTPIDLWDEQR